MGLDIVELLFAAEEKLGVHIHDADASNLTTPRMMADYVYFLA
jgi:acyl carrier protein